MLPLVVALGGCGRGESAPDFGYTLLDGVRRHSRELRGKVVLVNFWATTCAVCLAEMPQLVELYREFAPRGFELLAVAMSHDPPARVAHYAQSRQLPFAVVIDNTAAVARAFGDVRATPSAFLVDRRGAIVLRRTGALDFERLRRDLERSLSAI